ncbi:15-hydroxyprostaglandin dehydrogenase [Xylariaceae sp. FL0804]|nr:15-hydroxyprostaglandin dehydrogenase [Xylariaceae sp. FL0804]
MTEHFAARGDRVAVLDVNEAAGRAAAAEVAARHPRAAVAFWRCDIASWAEQARVFAEVHAAGLGRIDVVVANAGISEQGITGMAVVDEAEPSEPRLKVLDVNLTGTIYTVKLAVHYIKKNSPAPATGSRGSIICTASNAGLYPFPVSPLYAATKFGVIGLVRSMGPVLRSTGIQINALAPAVLETNIAPSKALLKDMVITPKSTLIKGVVKFLDDPGLTGEVAEIHGECATIRPHHDIVDEDSRKNLAIFQSLGYA